MAKSTTSPHQSSSASPGQARRGKKVTSAPAALPALELRLYVSPGAPNSTHAIANLEAIRREHFEAHSRIEIIDVFREPERALAEAVMLTPMLVKVTPSQTIRILGTLSDTQAVLTALGLPEP